MVCKNTKVNKWVGTGIFVLGIISFLYGLITFIVVQPEGKAANTLLGMFTGFGSGILLVGIRTLIHNKRATKEQLEQEEIDRNDERNIMILRTACTCGMVAAMIVLIVLAFVFMGMGLLTSSYLCIGGMYVAILTTVVARKILEKKL